MRPPVGPIAAILLLATTACGAAARDTTPSTAERTTTTQDSSELSAAELAELTELLDHWRQSALRRSAIDQWEEEVWTALAAATLDAMRRGELPGGDCRIGPSDYVFDCDVAEQAADDFTEMRRSGSCFGWLREWGCRNLDEIMQPHFELWAERNLPERYREWLNKNQ